MADPRFFERHGPFALSQLRDIGQASLAPGADADLEITDVALLDTAGTGELSFLDNRKYLPAFSATKAAACVVHPDHAAAAPQGISLLLSPAPYRSFALISQAFYPAVQVTAGISSAAMIDKTARVAATAQIAAGVVVEARAEIGERCRIDGNAVIGAGTVVGDETWIGANVSLSHCLIGKRAKIYPGARIGQDGFGFAMDQRGHVRVPQLGRVIVGDDAEIGANTTIDRGAGPDTVIGDGCMIDNLVQIAHNVEIGAGSVIVAQAGIAGSTKLGEFTVIAGQAGIGGHLKIGAGARVAAAAAVMRDVPPGQQVCGVPALPIREFWRRYARLEKLTEGKG